MKPGSPHHSTIDSPTVPSYAPGQSKREALPRGEYIAEVAAVDFGKHHDSTVITGASIFRPPPMLSGAERPTEIHIRALERLPLRMPYPQQVAEILAQARGIGPTTPIVFDRTGIGDPLQDMLVSTGHRPLVAVVAHGGQVTQKDRTPWGWSVSTPKKNLVEAIAVELETGLLKVPNGLALADALKAELLAFGVRVHESGRETFEGVGAHDDMVASLALTAWWLRQPAPPRMQSGKIRRLM